MPIETGVPMQRQVPLNIEPIRDERSDNSQREAQDLKEIDRVKREKALVDKELLQARLELERANKKEDTSDSEDVSTLKRKLEEARKEAEETKKKLEERDESSKMERFLNQNDDKYAFIKAEDAQEFVLREIRRHKEETGETLTVSQAADRVESQLKEINKKRVSRLKGNKEFLDLIETPPSAKVTNTPSTVPKKENNSSYSEKLVFKNRDDCIRQIIERAKNK